MQKRNLAFIPVTILVMLLLTPGLSPQDSLAAPQLQQGHNVEFVAKLSLPGNSHSVVTSGNYAYVSTRDSSLRVVDISDPTHPRQVGGANTPGSSWDVAVVEPYAYVVDGWHGLRVVDISNPSRPREVASVDTNNAIGITVAGSYAYVTDSDRGLRIIDISVPTRPRLVGSRDTPGWAWGVAVTDGYAFVADGPGGLRVMDVSNPTSPYEVDAYATPGYAADIVVVDGYAYVADGGAGLRIIDVSSPTNPYEVGAYDTPGSAQGVTAVGRYAYVSDWDAGLRIIDISDPTNPYEVGYYDTSGHADDAAVSGEYIYVADRGNDLVVLRFTPGGPLPDLTITAIEVTQGIQCLNNPDCFGEAPLSGGDLRQADTGGIYQSPETQVVYYNDFENAVGSEWSHRSRDTTPRGARRFLGQFWNNTVSLTLTDLPPHTAVTVSFDLFIIRSWDGNTPGGGVPTPDIWDLSIKDGPTVLHTTFSNGPEQWRRQAYPDAYPGGDHPPYTGAAEVNTLGYRHPEQWFPQDSVYRLSYIIPHSATSLALNFSASGLQSLSDESWGLDNVEVAITGLAEPDLTISRMEVTQGIQCLNNPNCFGDQQLYNEYCGEDNPNCDNAVPLVAGRPTWVRVYVDIGRAEGPVANVTARLHGQASTHSLGALSPENISISALKNPDQGRWDHSLNFRLPSNWFIDGSITLYAEVDPDNQVPEANEDNNTSDTQQVTFHPVSNPAIAYVPVTHQGVNAGELPGRSRISFLRLYPVGGVSGVYFVPWPGIRWPEDRPRWFPSIGNLWRQLLHYLHYLRLWYRMFGYPEGVQPADKVFAWLPGNTNETGDSLDIPSDAAYAALADLFVHELGHLYGRRHPSVPGDCMPSGRADPDSDWPFGGNVIIQEYGFDVFGDFGALLNPQSRIKMPDWRDFMSYCPEWVSPFTYTRLYEVLSSAARRQAISSQGSQPNQKSVAVSGSVHVNGTGQLGPAYVLDDVSVSSPPGSGQYCLEFQETDGTVLNAHCYGLSFRDIETREELEDAMFFWVFPFPNGTARIVLKQDGSVLDTATVSSSTPTIDLVSPNGGESWSGTQTITWTASDADGDPLTYSVLYSSDGGQSWIPVAVDVTQTSYEVDTNQIAGSANALIRVLATDGVNTASDDSDAPFIVATKPPQVLILAPEDGATAPPRRLVVFFGQAYDLEDGPLGDDALTWASDRDGVLGTGSEKALSTLSPGLHNITLTARDSDGNEGMAAINLFVGYRVYLPLALKNHSPGTLPPMATSTRTPTPSPTRTPTATATRVPTATPSNTPSPTLTLTTTATRVPTATPTITPTPTSTMPIQEGMAVCHHGRNGMEFLVAYTETDLTNGISLDEVLTPPWGGPADTWLNDGLKSCWLDNAWHLSPPEVPFSAVSYIRLEGDRLIVCWDTVEGQCAGSQAEMIPGQPESIVQELIATAITPTRSRQIIAWIPTP